MSTLYTVSCIIIIALFLISIYKFHVESRFAECVGKDYFMRRNTCLEFIGLGSGILIFSLVAALICINLDKIASPHWLTCVTGAIYALYGLWRYIIWRKKMAEKKSSNNPCDA